jgi:hypothetical protein
MKAVKSCNNNSAADLQLFKVLDNAYRTILKASERPDSRFDRESSNQRETGYQDKVNERARHPKIASDVGLPYRATDKDYPVGLPYRATDKDYPVGLPYRSDNRADKDYRVNRTLADFERENNLINAEIRQKKPVIHAQSFDNNSFNQAFENQRKTKPPTGLPYRQPDDYWNLTAQVQQENYPDEQNSFNNENEDKMGINREPQLPINKSEVPVRHRMDSPYKRMPVYPISNDPVVMPNNISSEWGNVNPVNVDSSMTGWVNPADVGTYLKQQQELQMYIQYQQLQIQQQQAQQQQLQQELLRKLDSFLPNNAPRMIEPAPSISTDGGDSSWRQESMSEPFQFQIQLPPTIQEPGVTDEPQVQPYNYPGNRFKINQPDRYNLFDEDRLIERIVTEAVSRTANKQETITRESEADTQEKLRLKEELDLLKSQQEQEKAKLAKMEKTCQAQDKLIKKMMAKLRQSTQEYPHGLSEES